MSSVQATVYPQSTAQIQAIANAWYQSVNQTAFVPFSANELRQRLVELTEKALDLLHANAFELQEAQAIGAALVDLHLIQSEAIGKTVELLARELAVDLPPAQLLTLQPRLSAILGGITEGFVRRATDRILSEQESVRQATVETLNALYSEVQQQQERLAQLNRELQANITERAQVEEALRASEQQFRALFEESPAALWALDGSQLYAYLSQLKASNIEDFRLYFSKNPAEIMRCIKLLVPVDVNKQALNVAGITSKENLLTPPYEILNRESISYLSKIIVGIANNETEGMGTATGISPAGREYTALYNWLVPLGYERTYARIFLSFVDITAQKATEKELQKTADRLEALHRIEAGILQAESPEAIANVALEQINRIIPSTSGSVTIFQASYAEAIVLASRDFPMKPGYIVPTRPAEVEKRKRDKALFIKDVKAIEKTAESVQVVYETGCRSLLSVPFFAQSELVGTINLMDAEPNAFSEQDITTIREIGDSVAIAIHNARLLAKEKRARREAETMRKIVASINASLEQEELLQIVLSQLRHAMRFDSASILLFENNSLVLAAQQGIPPETELFIRNLETVPANIVKIIEEKKPQIIADVREDPEWILFPGAENIRCWLGVPLIVKEALIGLLMMDYFQPYFYQKQDAAVALAFANHAAIAIENAHLYREAQQYATRLETLVKERTRELAALYKVTAITSQHLDLQEILDRTITVITQAVDCDAVSIHLLDETGSLMHLVAQRNLTPSMMTVLQEIPTSDYSMPELLEGGNTIIYTSPPLVPELANVPLPDTSSYGVATSILVKGTSLGVLSLSYEHEKLPAHEDVSLIKSIADHLGVAIENARLQEQSEQVAILEERERLARELHDSATQSLFSLTLFAAAAREHLSGSELEAVDEQLVELEKTAVRTHKDMRLLIYELRPKVLEDEGLAEALSRRIQLVEFRSGIRGQVKVEVDGKLPFSVEETLFQVANEALNNTLKHSEADTVIIEINTHEGQVEMSIADNGQGFAEDDADFNPGMGMENMRLRVQDLGGTLAFQAQPGCGTTIFVRIPLDK